jgi:hypothetical protein
VVEGLGQRRAGGRSGARGVDAVRHNLQLVYTKHEFSAGRQTRFSKFYTNL